MEEVRRAYVAFLEPTFARQSPIDEQTCKALLAANGVTVKPVKNSHVNRRNMVFLRLDA